ARGADGAQGVLGRLLPLPPGWLLTAPGDRGERGGTPDRGRPAGLGAGLPRPDVGARPSDPRGRRYPGPGRRAIAMIECPNGRFRRRRKRRSLPMTAASMRLTGAGMGA